MCDHSSRVSRSIFGLYGFDNFRWRPGIASRNPVDVPLGLIACDRGIAGRSRPERHGNATGNWLLKQCPRPVGAAHVEIKLDRTKRVPAAEMGTTSETLSRTLAKFRDQKLLRVKGNTVVVTKPCELQKLLQ